jgi:hypothetical protein
VGIPNEFPKQKDRIWNQGKLEYVTLHDGGGDDDDNVVF